MNNSFFIPLISECSLVIGGDVVHRQRMCMQCFEPFECTEIDKVMRQLYGKNGNMKLCSECDQSSAEEQSSKEDYDD